MIDASLDLQKGVRAQLIAWGPLMALVAASSVFDRNLMPEVFPCVLIGESHTLAPEGLARNRAQVYSDVHIWEHETGLTGVKLIAQAIRDALAGAAWSLDNHHVADIFIRSTRFMRDEDGIHSHAVMTIDATLVELGT
jgi:hypothetical protein